MARHCRRLPEPVRGNFTPGIARSRSGTGAEFTDMVARCGAAGVAIIVDAVINHMTNTPSPGVGSNGTAYTMLPVQWTTPNTWMAANGLRCNIRR